jgi:hypothetical protein
MRFAPVLLLALLLAGCSSDPAAPAPAVIGMPQVAGLFRYQGGATGFFLRGSITFEQEDDLVRVVAVTYDNANDRPLVGEAVLHGNVLDIVLVPENGDLDFEADCQFVFSADGSRFEVEFSDTNGDNGPLGSYVGTRQAQ